MERGGLTHENLYEHALRLPGKDELEQKGVRVRENRHWTAKGERDNYVGEPTKQGLSAAGNE